MKKKTDNNLLEDLSIFQFECDAAGLNLESIARLTRFVTLDFDSEIGQLELKRWLEVGLIKDGKIVITKNDLENLSQINFCLWDAVYKDDLQFIPPDHYSITERKKREMEAAFLFAAQEKVQT